MEMNTAVPQLGSRTEWRLALGIALIGLIGIAWWAGTRPSVEDQMARQDAERAAAAAEMRAKLMASGHGGAKVMPEQAFETCKQYLKQFSKDPEHIKIPAVGWTPGGINWRFVWGEQTPALRLRNGLGVEVAARGACAIDEVTGLPLLLVVDGQELIGPHSFKVGAAPSN